MTDLLDRDAVALELLKGMLPVYMDDKQIDYANTDLFIDNAFYIAECFVARVKENAVEDYENGVMERKKKQ